MNKGWLELESDPGLFTLLLEDFGVKGIQVEEIYDLQKPFEGQVYGFIFLFKWIEERRSRRKLTQDEDSFVMDEVVVNSMFFAQQLISNSCATHALVSILLNCDNLRLGDTLSKLKQFTKGMNPEDKGYAIGNMPDLARAHNSHARPEPRLLPEKQQGISAVRTGEAFHFVSFVPVHGHLFELDGLKPYPTDHGPWAENESWTEKFRRVISERLGMATGGEPYHDIRFNLMAVVPDRREQYQQKLKILKTNRQIVLEALQRMVKVTNPCLPGDSMANEALKLKSEPIITRSVAAAVREAAASAGFSDSSSTSTTNSSTTEKKPKTSRSRRSSKRGSNNYEDKEKDKVRVNETPEIEEIVRPPSQPPSRPPSRPPSVPIKIPPELDSHNYAKSPDMELQETGSQGSLADDSRDIPDEDDEDEEVDIMDTGDPPLTKQNWQVTQSGSLKMKISLAGEPHVKSVSTSPPHQTKSKVSEPLSIQTFGDSSPGRGSSSTDTASEVGSFLNSPNGSLLPSSEEPSPNTSTDEKMALDLSLEEDYELNDQNNLSVKSEDIQQLMNISASVSQMKAGQDSLLSENGCLTKEEKRKAQHQGFSPKDLVALLKNIEQEIKVCEGNLKDERDKRRKFQIDGCRRTHNYDQFICTFLSMLAEQGHLGELVEEQMQVKRRQGLSVGGIHRVNKQADKRKRPRPKKRR